MKKTILFTSILVMAISFVNAQKNGGFAKGDKLLNVGIGVNSYYSGGIPLGASFEVGITNDISIGGNVDYLSSKYDYGYGTYKFTALYFGARAAYHFNTLLKIDNDKTDLYGGLTLGYRSFSWSDTYSGSAGNAYGSGVYLGAFIGGKYYFGKNIGAFAELGAIGSTNARIGISFKL